MPDNFSAITYTDAITDSADFQRQFSYFRIRRLLQIIGFTLLGLILAVVVSSGATQLLILSGCIALLVAGGFALKQQALVSAYILLWSMALMLSALAYTSGGLRDLALLGYPGLLVYAAILGSSPGRHCAAGLIGDRCWRSTATSLFAPWRCRRCSF